MIRINISASNHEVSRLIDPAKIRNAMKSASQSAIRGVKTDIDSGVKTHFALERDPEQKKISTRASEKNASVDIKGTRLPLSYFRHFSGAGIGVTIENGENRRYPQAFEAEMKSGHRGIFQRIGRSRLPIRELYGASYPEMASKSEVKTKIIESMLHKYQSELVNHL